MRSPNTSTHIAQNPWMKTSSPTYVNGRLSRVRERELHPLSGARPAALLEARSMSPGVTGPLKNRTLRPPIFNDLWVSLHRSYNAPKSHIFFVYVAYSHEYSWVVLYFLP